MGKSTISMAMFNSFLYVYVNLSKQRLPSKRSLETLHDFPVGAPNFCFLRIRLSDNVTWSTNVNHQFPIFTQLFVGQELRSFSFSDGKKRWGQRPVARIERWQWRLRTGPGPSSSSGGGGGRRRGRRRGRGGAQTGILKGWNRRFQGFYGFYDVFWVFDQKDMGKIQEKHATWPGFYELNQNGTARFQPTNTTGWDMGIFLGGSVEPGVFGQRNGELHWII